MNGGKRAIAVLVGLLASGTFATGVSRAEEAVLIPGATVCKQLNPWYQDAVDSYPKIGINFHHDAAPQIVQYSQNALDSDRAILGGVERATAAVRQNNGEVVVIGESMGSMVAWRVAAGLADSPAPPAPQDIRVVLIAPPEVGVAEYFKKGTFIPVLNYRVRRIERSPYDTTIVIGEYDGWADPPDRPWNLIASANALAGVAYVHGPPIFTADVAGLTPIDHVEGDDKYGSVTTYLVPTKNLPLTQVFRDAGVPDKVVDTWDQALRPVIDAGYVRHDQSGDTRPYLADGAIRPKPPSLPSARALSQEPTPKKASVGQQRAERRTERPQARRGPHGQARQP